MKRPNNKRTPRQEMHVDVSLRGLDKTMGARKPPRKSAATIEVRPFANDPQKRLEDILRRIREGAEKHQYCNLSPSECDFLLGSLEATADALSSAECVVRQVALDTFGKRMSVKEFADESGYDS